MQTFILRFKFKGDKLITLGVGLHSNEEENFLNRIVKSELYKIVQGRHRNSARRGKRGIKVTGALRSAGFQKIPARPQIVFNRFTGLNMLV